MKTEKRRCKRGLHKIRAGYKSDFFTFLLGRADVIVPKITDHGIQNVIIRMYTLKKIAPELSFKRILVFLLNIKF